jgi:hypothetical protein
VHLVATTVVRLVGPLAHEGLFRSWRAVLMERFGRQLAGRRGRGPRSGPTLPGLHDPQPLTDQRYAVGSRRVKPATPRRQPPDRVARPWPGSGSEMPRSACGERVVPVARPGLGSHLTEVPYHPPGCVSVQWLPRSSPQLPHPSRPPRGSGVHSLWTTLWRAGGQGGAARAFQRPAASCQDPAGEGEPSSWSTPIRI